MANFEIATMTHYRRKKISIEIRYNSLHINTTGRKNNGPQQHPQYVKILVAVIFRHKWLDGSILTTSEKWNE